jgi:hypothetical protein
MTNIEFTQAGKKLTGFTKKRGYQKPFAELLLISKSNCKKLASGHAKILPRLEQRINELLELQQLRGTKTNEQ